MCIRDRPPAVGCGTIGSAAAEERGPFPWSPAPGVDALRGVPFRRGVASPPFGLAARPPEGGGGGGG
eukprot:10159292-Alexandrium_andersonii.AAC.1